MFGGRKNGKERRGPKQKRDSNRNSADHGLCPFQEDFDAPVRRREWIIGDLEVVIRMALYPRDARLREATAHQHVVGHVGPGVESRQLS